MTPWPDEFRKRFPGAAEVAGRPALTLKDEAAARALASFARAANLRLHPWAGGEPPSTVLAEEVILVTPGPGLTGAPSIEAADGYVEAPATMNAGASYPRLADLPMWVPFAAAGARTMTWGEVIARYPANAFAPLYGELNRLLLGVWVVNDDGERVHVGRRTIKGVAGYDLAKAFLGSYGRAGLICRVRLRLFPRPRDAAVWKMPRNAEVAADPEGACRLAFDEYALLYAEGYPSDLERRTGELKVTGATIIARGRAATEEFAAAAASQRYVETPAPDGAGPSLSDLFV